MSSEATAKEVSYKPVDIEEDSPSKRLGSNVSCDQPAKRLAGVISEVHI